MVLTLQHILFKYTPPIFSAPPLLGKDGKYHIFYVVINNFNEIKYYGKHSTEKLNDGYKGSGSQIKNAMKEIGKRNFQRIDLAFFESSDLAYEFEALAIDNSIVDNGLFYNSALGGDVIKFDNTGKTVSQETKNKLSISRKKILSSPEARKKMSESRSGILHTEEAKRRISLSGLGRKHSTETKIKMSKSAPKEKTDSFKLSMSNYAKNRSVEHQEKINASLTGRRLSTDHANKNRTIIKEKKICRISDRKKFSILAWCRWIGPIETKLQDVK